MVGQVAAGSSASLTRISATMQIARNLPLRAVNSNEAGIEAFHSRPHRIKLPPSKAAVGFGKNAPA
jgi:hypothetical protein